MKIVDRVFDIVKPYLTKEGLATIKKSGFYQFDREFGWVTPTIEGKMCAYGFRDKKGIIKCAFEQAYYDGKIEWKKPYQLPLISYQNKKNKRIRTGEL
jgi:hypothetical protein